MLVTLRPSNADDADFVNDLTYAVMQDYVKKTWGLPAEHDAYFEKNKFVVDGTRIIQVDNVDAGRVTVIKSENEIYLDNIHVLKKYQSRGIGSAVIKLVFEEADKDKLPVSLILLRSNPVKSLYERLGFNVTKETQTHYFMTRHCV